MDMDKLKQWMELAEKLEKGDFWKSIFETQDEAASEAAQGSKPSRYPAYDLYEREEENWVVLELPGLRKEDVELTLSGNELTVRGIARPPLDNAAPLHKERFYGPFERTIPLPQLGEQSPVHARFERGLLILNYERIRRKDEQIEIE
ncbi:Hsp20/alpha crystallin family protein [Paenibacillus ehimensis]|uniref:Hsp20/alpha crystallin family protein n=1 Tax=Paenibacillus ehimensis TaxID=79264 RepID=A0ABT8V8Y8_9BACL|nr:Hsp20/alpha crystallin family protein [Paenibacillus ehimensis]MDO3677433.1 Hsp20/alpha crystallin family protein [Paenibacillus ehimensis]MEC0212485.1 Hsp20/alpha crystallin family protein [Paenibacillus ehimensis]